MEKNLKDSLDEITDNLESIQNTIDEVKDLMIKMWRAEDMEENNGKFRWPFDEHGNLLPNVNISERVNGN